MKNSKTKHNNETKTLQGGFFTMSRNLCILTILISLIVPISLSSCQQDVIFYDIAQEIEYEAPMVEGNVYSMVPCGGQLFVQNNLIYQKAWNAKKNSSGKWTIKSVPVPGKPVVRLASDENYLYALVYDTAESETGSVYAAQVSSGTLGAWSSSPVAENVITLFDNRVFVATGDSAGTTTGRNAYFTASDKSVKKLAGITGTPTAQTATDQIGSTSSSDYIKTAASDGTTDYFSSNPAFAVIKKGSTTYLYTSFDGDTASATPDKGIKYKTYGSPWQSGGSTQTIVTSLTANGTDELLIGTYAGYETSTINESGVPGNGATPSGANDNAESAFGTRYITGIWHYGAEGTLYAAVVGVEHSQYNKLWGYYKSRNKWNYE